MNKVFYLRTFIVSILLTFGLNANAQNFKIIKTTKYDTIYFNNELFTIIKKDTIKGKAKFTCYYENTEAKYYSIVVKNYIDTNYNKPKTRHRINKFLGMQEVIVKEDMLYLKGDLIGYSKYDSIFQRYEITITKSGLSDKTFEKLELDLHEYYRKLTSKQAFIYIKTDYTEEIARINKEKARQEKERITRFYDFVFLSLKNPLQEIEGIYKSIDKGENFNYDIVILKSNNNSYSLESYILKSNDPEVIVGNRLITFIKTAEEDKFIMEYHLKSGKFEENKLAIFSGGIINAGVKSFVKMYPSKFENRAYNEIDTLVNWDASGSGVILNTKGYIATNYHVIKGAKKITVKIKNNKNEDVEFNAILIAQNENDDVAIIKIEDINYKPEHFNIKRIALSSEASFGQEVFTLGFPDPTKLGENVKLNKGIISAQEALNSKCYFQTDLPVWYGNSGGPCFNNKGELIGLVKGIMMDNKQKIENICYVVNSSCLYRLFNDELRQNNTIDLTNGSKTEVKFTNIVNTVLSNSAFIKIVY